MVNKIALIEDDASISLMYQLKLEQEGYDVRTASNGNLGYELIKSFEPDVVLLDVMMPESGGVDLLTQIRRSPDCDKLKIIIMTNLDDAALRKSMEDFKVTDYLVKAETTPAQVVEKIRALQ